MPAAEGPKTAMPALGAWLLRLPVMFCQRPQRGGTHEGTDFEDPEANLLWDEHLGAVPGGTNYAGQADLSTHGMTDHHIAIIGPEMNAGEPTP
ncbi:hypothetical protein ACFYNW_36045 [Streptomyces virginiae]|uniref:hypothetical protein n=1 Tax=Streptomyces virginiae TaxID=1961 RepID=UPI0036E60A45